MTESAGAKHKPVRTCCQSTGLIFPGGEKRCVKHQTAVDQALITELDRAAKPILGSDGWPYGADIDVAARQRLVQWANERHVTRAKTSCLEFHWLRAGRCNGPCDRTRQWMDHVTHWKAHGGPALVLAQPYHLYTEGIAQLNDLATTGDITINIEGDGWYGYGTVAIELWRTDAYERHRA